MADRAEPAHLWERDGASPPGSVALGELVLVERRWSRPPGAEWSAAAPGGRALEVWCATGLEAARRSASADMLSLLVDVRHPNLVPVLTAGERDAAVWVVSETPCGRPLRRLLAVATLTPEQAALVMVGVLDGLRALHEADLWHGRLDERTVHVGDAGQVRLSDWGLGLVGDGLDRPDPGALRAADLEAAAALFGRLGRNVRRATGGRHTGLLRLLEACGAGDGEAASVLARAREAAATLLEGGAGERATRELTALIGRLEREPKTPRPSAAPGAISAPTHPLRSPGAVWAPPSNRGRWAAGVVLLLLVAAAVAVGAAGIRHAPGRLAIAALPRATATPRAAAPTARPPAPSPTRAPAPAGPRPVPALAPAAAGPITAIEIQPLQGSCQPGQQCPVQVTVRLQPQPAAQEVRWSFHVFDRCTGATSVTPGVSVTALAGWAYVYGTSYPSIAAGHSLALVAVTDAPAAAASPAVLAGGSNPC